MSDPLRQLGRLARLAKSAALLWLFGAASAAANGQDAVFQQVDNAETARQAGDFGFRRGSVVVAPVPFSNPMIGSGLALGAGYLFKTAPDANTSVLGLGAMRSDNGSRATGLMGYLALPDNRWQFKLFAGEADVRYDLFTPLGPLPIRQDGQLARFELIYGWRNGLSAGITGRYLETSIRPDFSFLPPQFEPDADLEIGTLGLKIDWDKRDDSDYPANGFRLSAQANQAQTFGGSEREYQTGHAILDGYRSFGPSSVLALRGVVCGASSSTPFFDKCSIGMTDNMRGFNSTQFLGHRSVSVQAEFRQRFSKRLGGVAFAGSGWAGDTFDTLADGGSHKAAGLGIRYRVSKKFPVDFSVDYSRNDLGDNQLYIYVGQRF